MPRLALALFTVLCPVVRASDELCFTVSVPLQDPAWTSAVTVPRFDPALGVLTAVHLRLAGESRSTLAFESLDAGAQAVRVTMTHALELQRPDGSPLVLSSSPVARGATVAPFDGTVDFDGASGRTWTDVPELWNASATAATPGDLALFTGTDPLTLSVVGSATCRSTCACAPVTACTGRSGVDVTVCYAYEPRPTIHEADSVPVQPVGWTDTVTVEGFDPAWGRLEAVGLRLCGRVEGEVSLESLDPGPATATWTVDTTLALALPDGSDGAAVVVSDSVSVELGAHDGTIDFAGPSGAMEELEGAAQGLAVLVDPLVLAQFEVAGPLDLAVAATAVTQGTGPANAVTFSQISAGVDVEVLYVFRPCASRVVSAAVPPMQVAWADGVMLPQFDAGLGALVGVLLTVRGDVETWLRYENTDAGAATFGFRTGARVEVQHPSAGLLAGLDLVLELDEQAEPFDGTIDFGGPSGGSLPELRAAGVAGIFLHEPAELAAFTGVGTVSLPVLAVGVCELESTVNNYVFGCVPVAGLGVTATYVYEPPLGTASCFGVGCPCGNDDPAAGCASSTGAGALLGAAGSPSVACDDLVLSATGAPVGQSALFFMGDTATSAPLLDGLACAGGTTWRFLASVQATSGAGTASHTGFVAEAGGLIAPGTSWIFQLWFRDAPGSPCGGGANLSSAFTVPFLP